MQEKRPIRGVVTAAEDLESCNVEHIVRVFSEIAQTPKNAKSVRGTVVLEFPSYDDDARPNYAVPAICRFIRALDTKLPYFLYYIVTSPALSHMQFYLYCLVDSEDENKLMVAPKVLFDLIQRKNKDIRQFCYQIADQPDSVLEALMMNLPTALMTDEPRLTERTLRSMQDDLEGIVRVLTGAIGLPPHPNLTPEQSTQVMSDYMDDVLNRAAILAGLDSNAYVTKLELAKAVLGTLEPK